MGSFTKWLGKFLWGLTMPEDSPFKAITDNQSLQEALDETQSLIYKHSPICNLSSMAYRELTKFATTNTQVPVYIVDVLSNRGVSDQIENDLGIMHQSPQLILLSNGVPKWNDSHWSIKADTITVELAKLSQQRP